MSAMCHGISPCERMIGVHDALQQHANASPESVATGWTECSSCGGLTCDRCIVRQRQRCRCGHPIHLFSEIEKIRCARRDLNRRGASKRARELGLLAPDPTYAVLSVRCDLEAHLYMDIRGFMPVRWTRIIPTPSGPVTVFAADCDTTFGPASCFFRILEPGGTLGAGGMLGPSTVITPAEFALWADILASRCPGKLSGLSADDQEIACSELLTAAICTEEIMKFIPPGQDELFADAFPGERAQQVYAYEPGPFGRFHRGRLNAVARTYRGVYPKLPAAPTLPMVRPMKERELKSLRTTLEDIAVHIDCSRGPARRALARLAVDIVERHVAEEYDLCGGDIRPLTRLAEEFHTWGFFAEGVLYCHELLNLLDMLGLKHEESGRKVIARLVALGLLNGDISPHAPEAARYRELIEHDVKADTPLGSDALAVFLRAPPPPASPPPPPSPVPPPPRAEKLARSSFLAGLDATTKLALWVTLAFLEVAGADGVVAAREYVALKKNLVRLKLPDMRQQHGPEALQNMLRDGLLYELSSEYAVQSVEARTELANVLVEIMQADGAVDPRELEVVRRISNWLGLTLTGG